VHDLTPDSTVVSALPDIEFDQNVVQTFCHFDRFFASLTEADR
jgi:hypothetical protein